MAGAGAALGTGIALPGGSGRAVAATAPPRSALMTAALGRLRIAWENDLAGAYPLPAVRVPCAYDPELPLR
ncbi:hypothetical protein [Streptomyces parvus]|uniref:hypothetical protein n=1 Tax=Streptomyces parvus TaxID=66428 RepID=UPI002100B9B3|nr:hypothetical protein [Streptomyces parvus]MCQ1577995.1 hypothetical protein [Streptomyces parvus]